jgi:hypothetical protein
MKMNLKSCLQTIIFVLIFGFICYYVVPALFSHSEPVSTSTIESTMISNNSTTSTPVLVTANVPTTTLSALVNTTPTAINESISSAIPDVDSSELVSKDFKWEYEGSTWTWNLQIPKELYDYYKALPRSPTSDYSIYVTHPLDDKYIETIANKISQSAEENGYDSFQTVSFAAAFVQSLPYTSDLVTTGYDNYPRYPIETLVDNGGDCEDTAILAASLIQALGYGTVLLRFDATADRAGHVAVGVKGGEGIYGTSWTYEGDKYYYLETTSTGWEIGQIPDSVKDCSSHIYPMIPVPILTHDWTTKINGSTLELKVTIQNLGSAKANNVYVYAGFDAGNSQCWKSQQSSPFDLDVNCSEVVTLYLTPPLGKHTRWVIQIVYNGYAVDESYSSWFDT